MQGIMIVDDEPLIRKGLIKTIQRLAPDWKTFYEASNGRHAIETMEQNTDVNLIFTDIKMPQMNGIEMVEYLRSIGNPVTCIFLTGYDDFNYVQNALRFQAFDYLLKPIQQNELLKVINRFRMEKYAPVGDIMSEKYKSSIQKLEFDLVNALDSYNSNFIRDILIKNMHALPGEHAITEFQYINEVIRIINNYLNNKGIYGLDCRYPTSMNCSSYINSLSLTIASLLEQLHKKSETSNNFNDIIIINAKMYINNNLCESGLSLSSVAKQVYLNPTYFSQYFNLKTGEHFSNYIARLRVEKAKEMLKDPLLRVNNIADSLGYKDSRYFSKIFKKYTGMTPKEYRSKL